MKTKNRDTGDAGEDFSVNYLKKNGFIILDRNYNKPWGEIDIVAKKGKNMHFIEVKTVSIKGGDLDDYNPLFNIDKNKKDRLRRVIQTYLKDRREDDSDYQIDAIAIYIKERNLVKVEHLEDILL